MKAIDLRMDDDGVLPKSLAEAGGDAAILTPTLHNPTGNIWSEARRLDLLSVAARSGTLVIEDDAYGPLADIQPMAALHSDVSILFVSTLSKTVAPGLRTGFIWGRGPIIEKLSSAIYATSWGVAPLMMEVAIQRIEGGMVNEQIAGQRLEVEARHRLASAFFPELRGSPLRLTSSFEHSRRQAYSNWPVFASQGLQHSQDDQKQILAYGSVWVQRRPG